MSRTEHNSPGAASMALVVKSRVIGLGFGARRLGVRAYVGTYAPRAAARRTRADMIGTARVHSFFSSIEVCILPCS